MAEAHGEVVVYVFLVLEEEDVEDVHGRLDFVLLDEGDGLLELLAILAHI